MWAHKNKQTIPTKTPNGFTIVELLIVIVVIGILAAITIVAYNGVQNRARASAASSAAAQAAKRLEAFAVDGTGYPATLASVGITDGSTTYQYAVNNAVNPATYCLTATNGTSSYTTSSTSSSPAAGGCPGHGQGGIAPITNLAINPGFEIDIAAPWGKESSVATTYDTANKANGTRGLILTKTGTGSPQNAIYLDIPVTQGDTYTLSYSLKRISASADYDIEFRQISNQATIATSGYLTTPTTLTRLSISGIASATGYGRLYLRAGSGAIGDAFMIDSLMVTSGSSTYTYADGSSPNWAWTGPPNNSTSTGPPL